jgi:hypothetical protein
MARRTFGQRLGERMRVRREAGSVGSGRELVQWGRGGSQGRGVEGETRPTRRLRRPRLAWSTPSSDGRFVLPFALPSPRGMGTRDGGAADAARRPGPARGWRAAPGEGGSRGRRWGKGAGWAAGGQGQRGPQGQVHGGPRPAGGRPALATLFVFPTLPAGLPSNLDNRGLSRLGGRGGVGHTA